ncbi:MAG: hypothetical protein Q8N53_03665 [Longimicrobiales bacterium]|nr:hypothetical protein [Longimicrobiales bacterium]
MPLTPFQRDVLALLARTRSPDSYLAGGAALHFAPNSLRYSNDLDFFHDSAERVSTAYAADESLLREAGYGVAVELSQPGFIRAIVDRDGTATRIDWAHVSAWRFMPPVQDELGGFLLHQVDLAVNKTLALAGRDEPRDYADILFIHERILPLGALCWAAAGKDPGFTPLSLLELLRRRGRHRPEDIARLAMAGPVDLAAWKRAWLAALEEAAAFARARPGDEVGCLYYATTRESFVMPDSDRSLESQAVVLHFGSPGGVLPQVVPQ